MSEIECIGRQERRIYRYLVISVQKVHAHIRAVVASGNENISVVLVFIVCRRYNAVGCLAKVILTVLPCIAEHAIAVGSIVERARR